MFQVGTLEKVQNKQKALVGSLTRAFLNCSSLAREVNAAIIAAFVFTLQHDLEYLQYLLLL
jgi:hypothetical protein